MDESQKKIKRKKSIKKNKDGEPQMKKSKIVQKEEKLAKVTEEKKRKKKRFEVQIRKSKEETDEFHSSYSKDESDIVDGRKKKSKSPKQKKRKNERPAETESVEVDQSNDTEDQLGQENNISNVVNEHERKKSRRKKRKSEKKEQQRGKSKDGPKVVEEDPSVSITEDNLVEERGHAEEEVYELSSGDEDCTKGMKKWVTDYYQSRPGLEVLQERIDEFITAYETKKEQERKEKEALAAEGGWTVVVHHKGRKKTTESETGIAVGSVSQAAVMDNVAKKKKKDVGLDFYRFQKREAKRNEIMVLQSKFEQDKKRIQQLRAARKFKPY